MSYFNQMAALFRFLCQNRKARGRYPRLLKAIGIVPEQYPRRATDPDQNQVC
jgi:hypothetical protein